VVSTEGSFISITNYTLTPLSLRHLFSDLAWHVNQAKSVEHPINVRHSPDVSQNLGSDHYLSDFTDIVISMKSSTVSTMIDAYRLAAQQCAYPLHLGVTEAGTAHMGLIKSAIGIGALLHDGIGATIRVSLTDDPIQEIAAAKDILKCMGLRGGPELVACPTCGRTRIDLVQTAKEVEAALANVDKDIKVAVMGCVVNGPGEAREADIGIAGGDGCAVLFKKGEVLRKIPESEIVTELMKEIEKF